MKLFYDKNTGEIRGTVDGFGPDRGIKIAPDDPDVVERNIQLGDSDEQLARNLLNPHYELDIEMVRIKDGLAEEKTEEEKQQIKENRRQAAERAANRPKEPTLEQRVERLENNASS